MSVTDSHICQIAAGDREAFAKLHNLLYDPLFFYAYKIVGDVAECEDLIQDTFIHYWENREDFGSIVAVKTYLYKTLDYKIKNQLRKKERQQRIINEIPVQEDSCLQDDLIIAAEIALQVRQAIRKLPPRTSKVLELSLLDMSLEEIAAEMNISVNSVKTLKQGGYRVLRKSLAHLRFY